jgi:hypothetical protein
VEFHSDGFETNLGWSSVGAGEWQFAAPQGLGGGPGSTGLDPKPDPTEALEGSGVLGNDLTGLGEFRGRYEDNVTSTITSPAIDASGAVEVELRYSRWLNVAPFDLATLEVSGNGGGSWNTLFSTDEGLTAEEWTQDVFDVSAEADANANFLIRFGLTSDMSGTLAGWNIDDLKLFGVTKDSCEPVGRPVPGFAGSLVLSRGAPGELSLSWQEDCGAGTLYGVYRGDLEQGYGSLAPEPGYCGVSGTGATVPEGEGTADFFLVVPNDGTFEGSYGGDSAGAERSSSLTACHPKDLIDGCAP